MKDAATAPVKSKGCSVALMAVKEPAWTKQRCNSGGAPLLFPTAFYPTLKRGRYPFTAVFFSQNAVHKLCFEPGTFSTGDERSNHLATPSLSLLNFSVCLFIDYANIQLALNGHKASQRFSRLVNVSSTIIWLMHMRCFKGVMSWPKVSSIDFRFWGLRWTNGPNIQLKWKLRHSPIQVAYLEPSVTHFSDR